MIEKFDPKVCSVIKRIRAAKDILETRDVPIKSAAEPVGYKDAYHFSKLFRSIMNILYLIAECLCCLLSKDWSGRRTKFVRGGFLCRQNF